MKQKTKGEKTTETTERESSASSSVVRSNVVTISHEILLNNEYRNWKMNEYQKRIYDDKGTKYFINIKKVEVPNFIGWFPEIQFNIVENDQSISVSLVQWLNDSGIHTGITLAEIENYLDEVWYKLNGKYYE